MMTLVDQIVAKRFDERRFACTRHAGNTDADGFTCMGQQGTDDFLGTLLMVRTGRFDQRNGLGESPPLFSQDTIHQLLVGGIQHARGRDTCIHLLLTPEQTKTA